MPRLNKNDQKIQDAFKVLMETIHDYMPVSRHKSIIATHVETAMLIHRAISEREDTK